MNICKLPRDNLVNRAKTPAEAQGLIFGFHQMRRLGYRLENVSLHYNDNQGLDMIFSTQSGDLAMVTTYAVVEAKNSSKTSALKVFLGGRQGSEAYNKIRLESYLDSSDPVHRELALMLLKEMRMGRLESYVTLAKANKILLFPKGWPERKAVVK